MTSLRKIINEWNEALKELCSQLSPEKRTLVLLVMCFMFGISFLYIFANAIYNISEGEVEQMEIEHIRQLQLQELSDSIKPYNFYQDGTERNDDSQ